MYQMYRSQYPYTYHVIWLQRAGEFELATAKIRIRSNVKSPLVPLHSTLFTTTCPQLEMKRMIPQHETLLLYSTSRFLEVRSAKFYGRREELLVIVSRGMVDSSLTVHCLVSHPVCCLSPVGIISLLPRNHHHAGLPSREHNVQTL